MPEHVITSIYMAVSWGKLLSNPRKVMMLLELSKGDLPKSKIAGLLGVKISTVNTYAREAMNLGIVEEYPMVNKGHLVHMLRLTCDAVNMEFKKITETEGWKDGSRN